MPGHRLITQGICAGILQTQSWSLMSSAVLMQHAAAPRHTESYLERPQSGVGGIAKLPPDRVVVRAVVAVAPQRDLQNHQLMSVY